MNEQPNFSYFEAGISRHALKQDTPPQEAEDETTAVSLLAKVVLKYKHE